jgi:hypothetical protein
MRLRRIYKKEVTAFNAYAAQKSYKFAINIYFYRDNIMTKLFLVLLLSAFTLSANAADTDNQKDGAELGTNETPQAQDQSKNSDKSTNIHKTKKSRTHSHANKKTNAKAKTNSSSENNPLQPTEPEPAPGASTQ